MKQKRCNNIQLLGHVIPEMDVPAAQEEERVPVANAALDGVGLGGLLPPAAVLGEGAGPVDVDRPERLRLVRVDLDAHRVLWSGGVCVCVCGGCGQREYSIQQKEKTNREDRLPAHLVVLPVRVRLQVRHHALALLVVTQEGVGVLHLFCGLELVGRGVGTYV